MALVVCGEDLEGFAILPGLCVLVCLVRLAGYFGGFPREFGAVIYGYLPGEIEMRST